MDSLREGDTVDEISADDPYELSVASLSGTDIVVSKKALLVTGAKFPDALAGIAVARKTGVPLLLVPPDCFHSETKNYLSRIGITSVEVLGGTSAVYRGVGTMSPSC